jgi:NAD-dependent deacetylase
MGKKKIVFFTGAGVSAESGVATFRTGDGLWMNHKVSDVATPEGWANDRDLVNKFYNERREELSNVKPNEAHMLISDLEDDYDVTVVTQNVDDLHERGGSSNVIHLHGELSKVRSTSNPNEVIEWGYKPLTDSDRGENNARLRPHIVWFGEMPFRVTDAAIAIEEADIMVVIGTSFNIGYTLGLVNVCKRDIPIYYIDPKPALGIFEGKHNLNMVTKTATKGMKIITNILKKK